MDRSRTKSLGTVGRSRGGRRPAIVAPPALYHQRPEGAGAHGNVDGGGAGVVGLLIERVLQQNAPGLRLDDVLLPLWWCE